MSRLQTISSVMMVVLPSGELMPGCGDASLPPLLTDAIQGATGMISPENGVGFVTAGKVEIFPITLGRAVRRFCRTDASFDILWSKSAETKKCGWSDGGCWTLSSAIQYRWGGNLYCLSFTGFDAQHVVLQLGDFYIDQDGLASAEAVIRRFKRWGCFFARSVWLLPFSPSMGAEIPKPRNRNQIVAGICKHLT